MDRKIFHGRVKEAAEGKALVVIATLNTKDEDGDVTLPGYFGAQTAQAIGAHDWRSVPIGKAKVYEQGNEALAAMAFNLETVAGKDWFSAIAFDFTNPPAKQEYSYGFTIKPGGSRVGLFGGDGTAANPGEEVRFLVPLGDGSAGCFVHEVSPVLLGAGVDTRTLDVKGGRIPWAQEIANVREMFRALEARTVEIAAMRAGKEKPKPLSAERVAELKELRDELGRFAAALGPLCVTGPTAAEALALYAEFQRTTFDLSRIGA